MRLIDADALEYTLGCSDEDIVFSRLLQEAPTVTELILSVDLAKVKQERDAAIVCIELMEDEINDRNWYDLSEKILEWRSENLCSAKNNEST